MKKATYRWDGTMLNEGIQEHDAILIGERHSIYLEDDTVYWVEVERIKDESEEVYQERPGAEFVVLARFEQGKRKPSLDDIADRLYAMSAVDLLELLDTQNGCEFHLFK